MKAYGTGEIAAVVAGYQPKALIIAGSAGGVDALLNLLPQLPPRFSLPVICILHVPGDRESRLAELFDARIIAPVKEAHDKVPVAGYTVYFAPSGYHLSIERDKTFSLSCEAPVHFARPAIDVLLESAADVYGAGLAAILLTGANQDGAAGMARVRQRGGLTVVQDPADAQASMMPESAIKRCPPDLVLPLAQIGALFPMLEK